MEIEQTPTASSNEPNGAKPNWTKWVLTIVLVILLSSIAMLIFATSTSKEQPEQIACTQDAKLCPDGSYVGRTGPNCEFTPCPSSQEVTPDPTVYTEGTRSANWKTYTDTKYGYSLEYPNGWFIKDMTSTHASDTVNAQYFNDNQTIDLNNNLVRLTVDSIDIERSKRFLNYGDAGLQNKAEIVTEQLDGKEIIKAVVTFSQLDPNTGKYKEESKSYRVLIPIGFNTLTIHSDLSIKDQVDQILSTFQFTK